MAKRGRPKNGEVREAYQDTQAEEDTQVVEKSNYEKGIEQLQLDLNNAIISLEVIIAVQQIEGKSYQRFIQAKYDLQRMQKRLK